MGFKKKFRKMIEMLTRDNAERSEFRLSAEASLSDMLDKFAEVQVAVEQMAEMQNHLEENLSTFSRSVEQISATQSQVGENLTAFSKTVKDLSGNVRKHDMSLEDLIDGLDRRNAEQEEANQRLAESRQSSEALLRLVMGYQDTLFDLRSLLSSSDESWAYQFSLIDEKLKTPLLKSDLTVLQDVGIPVDYDLHEVVDAVETNDPEADKTIAQVFSCGYVFRGTVLRKAKVVAFRYVPAQDVPEPEEEYRDLPDTDEEEDTPSFPDTNLFDPEPAFSEEEADQEEAAEDYPDIPDESGSEAAEDEEDSGYPLAPDGTIAGEGLPESPSGPDEDLFSSAPEVPGTEEADNESEPVSETAPAAASEPEPEEAPAAQAPEEAQNPPALSDPVQADKTSFARSFYSRLFGRRN